MTTSSPESLALLGRAAELRAGGMSWDAAATRLSVATDELRRLAAEHSREYDRLMRRAFNDVLREAMNEAVATLRGLLTSKEPGVGRAAATTLARYSLARMRQGVDMASERLTRKPRKLTVKAENVRAENVSESAEVSKRQNVDAAKKVAQSRPAETATRVPSPVPATPPAAPPAPARPATPPAEPSKPSEPEMLRRKRLLDAAVLGHLGPRVPITKAPPQTLEVDRLMQSCLGDGK